MLNAREDHVEEHYGYTYEQFTAETGCTLIAIQNEISYLKEVRYNARVEISSQLIELHGRVAKVEILMKDPETQIVNAVFWCTVICFNMKTRKSDIIPDKFMDIFHQFHAPVEHATFQDRVNYFRKNNKHLLHG